MVAKRSKTDFDAECEVIKASLQATGDPVVDAKVRELVTAFGVVDDGEEEGPSKQEVAFLALVATLPEATCSAILTGLAGNRDIPTRVKLFSAMLPEYRELKAASARLDVLKKNIEAGMKYCWLEHTTPRAKHTPF